jgi:GNAT superfamily N-acetyltransferase
MGCGVGSRSAGGCANQWREIKDGPCVQGLEAALDSIEPIVVPATAERWEDVLQLFGGQGTWGCWCQYWRQSSSDYRKVGPGGHETSLKNQVMEGPPPGMLAYVEDKPVGWLGFWPRDRLARLVRSRTIPKIDELPVWSIVCFLIRVGYRRKGVAKALLKGAIEFAREAGVPALEAYPIDSEGARLDVAFSYVGFVHMFEAAGFRRVIETDAKSAKRTRILMRLELK